MDKIEQQIKKFNSLNFDLIFRESVIQTKDLLLVAVRDQMLSGKGSDGNILGEYAWIDYAEFKTTFTHGGNAPFGIYDFSLTGDFHDAMFISFDSAGNILVDSTNDKTNYLEELAGGGQRVFGLMEEGLSKYNP